MRCRACERPRVSAFPTRRPIGFRLILILVCCAALPCAIPALAQTAPLAGAADPRGPAGGLHAALAHYGVTFSLHETSEVLGNLTGGVRRGFEYDGLTKMKLLLHTVEAFGWP